jgi:hypothetical protein
MSHSSSSIDSAKRKAVRKSAVTPQRKHHKMLKDGTSEVWPEDVEKVFIQGMHPLLLSSLSYNNT